MKQDIYNYNKYGDNLARKKRHSFFLKIGVILCILLILSGVSFYFLFFSNFLQITEQIVEGLQTLKSDEVYTILDSTINQSFLGISVFKPQKNIFFFSDEFVVNKIRSDFAVVEKVKIIKNYPHKIIVQIEERKPVGIWCFNSNGSTSFITSECRYFDQYGVLWGQALKSSGSLFLNIDDQRLYEMYPKKIDPLFQEAFNQVVASFDKLSIAIRKIIIPNDSVNDFHVYVAKGYYLLFNVDSEVSKQIESLEIFLANKGDDFMAEYVDARISGRIYYK